MRKIIVFLSIFISFKSFSQQSLSLNDAINFALKNNLDIQIANNNLEAGKINNSYGVAGGLPQIGANVIDNQYLNNYIQQNDDGSNTTTSNIAINNLSAGLTGSITLFNGFKVYAAKNRLEELQKQSEFDLSKQIQSVIADVMLQYFAVTRQQQYLKVIQQSIDLSQQRLDLINVKKQVGYANNADVYQSQIDLNNSKQNYSAQQLILQQSISQLQLTLNLRQDSTLRLSDTIEVTNDLRYDAIQKSISQNPQLLSAKQQVLINEWLVKEARAERIPSLKLNTGYNYTRSNSNFLTPGLYNQTYGPFVGLNLEVPIYNGNAFKKNQQVLNLNMQNADLIQQQVSNNLNAGVYSLWQSYQSYKNQLQQQEENFQLAKNLLQIVTERYQLNVATIIELREAQKSFDDAGFNVYDLRYKTKSAEIQLKQLANMLGN